MGVIKIRQRVITPEQVKAEASRRIEEVIPHWMIEREVTGGKAIPDSLKKQAQKIRDKSDALEGMSPIPVNYTAQKYWR